MMTRRESVTTDHAQQGGITSCPWNSWRVHIALHYKPDVYSLTMVRIDDQDVLSQSQPFQKQHNPIIVCSADLYVSLELSIE